MDNINNNYIQENSPYHVNNPNWENYPGDGIERGIILASDINSLLNKNDIIGKIGGGGGGKL
jgi:hypothetical protein